MTDTNIETFAKLLADNIQYKYDAAVGDKVVDFEQTAKRLINEKLIDLGRLSFIRYKESIKQQ